MELEERDFQRIVQYVKSRTGIELKEKRILIAGRLENFLVQNGYSGYEEYLNKVEGNQSGEEATILIDRLTTNHTYFLREADHFEFLREVILPEIKEREKRSRDIRIWSAASSTGEEPYTIAMLLHDFFCLEQEKWDTTILATDISKRVLEHAIRGEYLTEQVQVLPQTWQHRYLKQTDELHCTMSSEIRQAIEFRQFNLMNPFPFKRKFHVVFLRNVMIYFDSETKCRLIEKIYDCLADGGYLIIGSTEGIDRSKTKFRYIKPSVFQKNER